MQCSHIHFVCSNGVAVENPSENGGLVWDCALLLDVRDTLAGAGSLNWSEDVSFDTWLGVEIDSFEGEPRVTALQLVDSGLTGQVPAQLAGLDGL